MIRFAFALALPLGFPVRAFFAAGSSEPGLAFAAVVGWNRSAGLKLARITARTMDNASVVPTCCVDPDRVQLSFMRIALTR